MDEGKEQGQCGLIFADGCIGKVNNLDLVIAVGTAEKATADKI